MEDKKHKIDGRSQNRAKVRTHELVSKDDLKMHVIAAFCQRVYSGQTLGEAAHNVGTSLSVIQAHKFAEPSLRAVFEFAERREDAPRDIKNPGAGIFNGPLEQKALLAHEMVRVGLVDKVVAWVDRIDPDGDPEEFNEQVQFILKNRVLDQVFPRTSASQDRMDVRTSTADTRSMDEVREAVNEMRVLWEEEEAKRKAAEEHALKQAERLKELNAPDE